ncbi:N-acetylmuramoyl-L-alanine amidase [Desulfosporosinus sp.]|uniref:N-acetylmuramoyl-L-alanine amidase family protein n=1 Tax=Desulfosporosinus sp. TaxID=157907 RepID=UPI0026163892|nr:N-acetylmuramoyl-L-alanine amidase [Desulfosporosinus sp.]
MIQAQQIRSQVYNQAISLNTQSILNGNQSSAYPQNDKGFPSLPSQPSRSTNPSSDPQNFLADKTIVIDPGHGTPDVGAIGPSGSYEKDDVLAIALVVSSTLKQAGAKVILTRHGDNSPASPYTVKSDLASRVDLANTQNADFFISLHANSYPSPDVAGTTTYYNSDNPKSNESLRLANAIQAALAPVLNTNNRGVQEADYKTIKITHMPAVLIEVAFISNPTEEKRLQDQLFRSNVATGILKGLYSYVLAH